MAASRKKSGRRVFISTLVTHVLLVLWLEARPRLANQGFGGPPRTPEGGPLQKQRQYCFTIKLLECVKMEFKQVYTPLVLF